MQRISVRHKLYPLDAQLQPVSRFGSMILIFFPDQITSINFFLLLPYGMYHRLRFLWALQYVLWALQYVKMRRKTSKYSQKKWSKISTEQWLFWLKSICPPFPSKLDLDLLMIREWHLEEREIAKLIKYDLYPCLKSVLQHWHPFSDKSKERARLQLLQLLGPTTTKTNKYPKPWKMSAWHWAWIYWMHTQSCPECLFIGGEKS